MVLSYNRRCRRNGGRCRPWSYSSWSGFTLFWPNTLDIYVKTRLGSSDNEQVRSLWPESLVAIPLPLPTPTAANNQSKSKTGSPTLRSFACTGNQQQLKIKSGFSSVTLVDPRSSSRESMIPNKREFDQLWSNHGNHCWGDQTCSVICNMIWGRAWQNQRNDLRARKLASCWQKRLFSGCADVQAGRICEASAWPSG